MPVLNLAELMPRVTSSYPAPFDKACEGRRALRLSDAGGLNQFGANLVTLAPKAWASQRHHHSAEDELVYIISGHPTLVDDSGEQRLSPGDVCTHAAALGSRILIEDTGSVKTKATDAYNGWVTTLVGQNF